MAVEEILSEHVREANFVNHMVITLIERFNQKLGEITPGICEETVLRESGVKGINAAMDRIEAAKNEVDDAKATHSAMVDEFCKVYGEGNCKILDAAETKLRESMAKQQADFEFKIRDAIGLVELVGSVEAYDVLQSCRIQIENMVVTRKVSII